MDAEHIAGRTFKQVRKGVDPKEVRSYIHALATELLALAEENKAMRAEILALETQLGQSRDMEQRVRAMLAELQRATKNISGHAQATAIAAGYKVEQERKAVLEQARREADIVIRDAERRAERVVAQGNERLATLQQQIDLIETRKIALISRMKAILRAQTDFLAALEHTPRKSAGGILGARKTREGLDAGDLNDIIERLEDRES
jgi:cell division septum initiation protein DivIVA